MLQTLLERAYRRLGPRYLPRALFFQMQLVYAVIVFMVAVGSAYVELSLGEFVRLALLGCGLQFAYNLLDVPVTRRLTRPVAEWLEGSRAEQPTVAAWRSAASLPWELTRHGLFSLSLGAVVWLSFLVWSLYAAWELELSIYAALLMYVGAMVLVLYATCLRFFGVELIVRPVLNHIAAALPDRAVLTAPGPSLRARLLAVLPAINVITAVIAHALTGGGDKDLATLATVVLVAAAVAGTVSLVLTLLLSNSVTAPIARLREATKRVGGGDFRTRVPVVTTDETGELAQAFNEMTAGLAERERIREAFGTYVDREVAEHILSEGTSLEGEEVEVSMMFIDIRDFTGYAERAPAPQVVATLNRLWERIVPIVHERGGHVDKFVGDGLLAVFGAPRRLDDHADQALAAALEIARAVEGEFAGALGIGIGINSGTVVAGNVGGGGRLEFSVIGDAVNVAARVEAATRTTGDTILVSQNTRRLLRRTEVPINERPQVPLKGKREAVALYAPEAVTAPRA